MFYTRWQEESYPSNRNPLNLHKMLFSNTYNGIILLSVAGVQMIYTTLTPPLYDQLIQNPTDGSYIKNTGYAKPEVCLQFFT